MVHQVNKGRYEVEKVEDTPDVWWVYDYRKAKGAMVQIVEELDADGNKIALQVTNEESGSSYRVNRAGVCSCKAGQAGRFCYHVAAVTGRAMEIRRERSAKALANIAPSGMPLPRHKPAPPACLGNFAGRTA
jgi:hypothetical protein